MDDRWDARIFEVVAIVKSNMKIKGARGARGDVVGLCTKIYFSVIYF